MKLIEVMFGQKLIQRTGIPKFLTEKTLSFEEYIDYALQVPYTQLSEIIIIIIVLNTHSKTC